MPLLSSKPKKAPAIRVEKVQRPSPSPSPRPRYPSSAAYKTAPRASPKPIPRGAGAGAKSKSASPYPSSSSDERRRVERKRKYAESSSASASHVKFDDDDSGDDGAGDDDWTLSLDMAKRQRRSESLLLDKNRTLTYADAFEASEDDKPRDLRYIHATDITNTAAPNRTVKRALGATEDDDVRVQIQYPSLYAPENYELLVADGNIDAIGDVLKVVNHIAYEYLTESQAAPFTDRDTGFIRRLQRASNTHNLSDFKAALADANAATLALARDGTIRENLDSKHSIPRSLVEFVLAQVYDRTVSPDVEKLRQYKNGTDNVYGELKHVFVSKILQEKTRMTSDHVFVDLGSGVGNVVFQAALEIGCESWGCEMMDNPCDFAEAQQREFDQRCRLWGLAPGRVNLVRGDFLTQAAVHDVLKRADVVLVNNQAFTPQLNDKLAYMFLDLKVGCKIVSLKSFMHDQGVRSVNDVASNILEVEQHTFPDDHVSWTGNGGTFFVSTRK